MLSNPLQTVDPRAFGLDASRVLRRLWIGSKPTKGSAVGRAGFQILVLCAKEIQPRSADFPGVTVVHAGIDDAPSLSTKEIDTAFWAARGVARAVADGRRVLVTCAMGLNRSGLVTALAVHALTGLEGNRCIDLVRAARPGALFNEGFVEIIRRV